MSDFQPAPSPLCELMSMLATRRPAWTKSEAKWIKRWIDTIPGVYADTFGNRVLAIGDAPTVLWSAHTDTVHRDGGLQSIILQDGIASLAPSETQSNCLGADDTAGCWMLRQMALAGIPGLYIWHRAEEIGGLGSTHIAEKTPDLLAGIKHAIAFDRRGCSSVITHQGYGRCCSDTFAQAITSQMPGYRLDDGGLFTDTANYVDLVGECTNLSVGYLSEHTKKESLDTGHCLALLETMLTTFDATALPSVREPGEVEEQAPHWLGRRKHDYAYGWDVWDDADQVPRGSNRRTFDLERQDMTKLVAAYPEMVADILEAFGMDVAGLVDELEARGAQ